MSAPPPHAPATVSPNVGHSVARYQPYAGRFKHTKTLATLLRHAGIVAPHTGEPWTEAMLLGLGGGLGAGYILWEFKAHSSAVLTLGFHHRWNYAAEWYDHALRRVGAEGVWMQTGGKRRAAKALEAALRNGHPAACWVDEFHMPYLHVGEAFEGCFGWVVTVIAADDEHAVVDEVWGKPLTLDRAALDQARARIGSYKHRQLTVNPGAGCADLAAVVREGIAAHVDYLGGTSTSFGLGALRKWGRTLNDRKNNKGWPRVFADRTRLASVFRSMREGIALRGMDGAGLRALYADFLAEAADALGDATLREASATYADLAHRWRALADAPFPGADAAHPMAGVDRLTELRDALDARFAALQAGDLAAVATESARTDRLNSALDRDPPWTSAQQDALFAALSEQVQGLWLAERAAVSALRDWL